MRSGGVVAGIACADEAFRQVDASVAVAWSVADGALVEGGTTIGVVEGPLASILTAERTALNFLGHLSGIATLTRRFVVVAAAAGDTRIWDTRKTTPGLRSLEKAAVRAGGGANHRGNLSDWVLLKDNHLGRSWVWPRPWRRLAGPLAGTHRARRVRPHRPAARGARGRRRRGAPRQHVARRGRARRWRSPTSTPPATGRRRPLLEISGGITLETVTRYVGLGADMISVGGITNSAPVLDIGLDIEPGS